MLHAFDLIRLHDDANQTWHAGDDLPSCASHLEQLVLHQHHANYSLWHEEDKARSPQAPDPAIAAVKHTIDELNQRRNDLVEQMDELLLLEAGDQQPAAPLHSETPGLIIDRLSILALKVYHTAQEAHRESATPAHRERNLHRLAVLEGQRADLAGCLDDLWNEVLTGRRRFKLYRQMKMYNDPELNPVLYAEASI